MVFSVTSNPTSTQVDAFLAQAEGEFTIDSGVTFSAGNNVHVYAVLLATKIKVIEYWRSLNLFASGTSNGGGENYTWSPTELQAMKDKYAYIIAGIAGGETDTVADTGEFTYGW